MVCFIVQNYHNMTYGKNSCSLYCVIARFQLVIQSITVLICYMICYKDWAGKKVTILYSTLLMVKSSEIIWFFNLHFTWLCGSWNPKKDFEKYQFWKYDSCFSSCVSKFTSVKYPWNVAFSDITKIDFYPYCLIIVIVLTKCSLYCI